MSEVQARRAWAVSALYLAHYETDRVKRARHLFRAHSNIRWIIDYHLKRKGRNPFYLL